MAALDDLARRIAALDAKIEPLIWRLDLNAPDLRARLKAEAEKREKEGNLPYVPVLDRSGLRDSAEALLRDILATFRTAAPPEREAIRDVVREHRHFAWAIGGARDLALGDAPLSVERCRDCLTWFAIEDQGRDPRDAILWLHKLCAAADAASLPTASLLAEAADSASDVARFAVVGASSTRALLVSTARRYETSDRST